MLYSNDNIPSEKHQNSVRSDRHTSARRVFCGGSQGSSLHGELTSSTAGRMASVLHGPRQPSPPLCVHELIERAAQRVPSGVALELLGTPPKQVSYAALLHASAAVAERLHREGCRRGDLVGILIARSIEFIQSLVGVLSAGGAFVPMDPTYPAQRLGWMAEDAQASVLLVTRASGRQIPGGYAGHAVYVDRLPALQGVHGRLSRDETSSATPSSRGARAPSHLDDLAYCIFTSGSTGRPKGVLVEHRAAVNIGCEFIRRWEITPIDRIFQFFSPSFDPSILDYMLAVRARARGSEWVVGATRVRPWCPLLTRAMCACTCARVPVAAPFRRHARSVHRTFPREPRPKPREHHRPHAIRSGYRHARPPRLLPSGHGRRGGAATPTRTAMGSACSRPT